MFLSHTSIERLLNDGSLVIEPDFDKKNLRPLGIRIHLAREILVPEDGQTVDLTSPSELRYTEVDLEHSEFYLEPGQFILGATYEAIQTPKNILAILDGRSTVARLGLTTHITASIADGTFEQPQAVVLEMKNVGNFRIRLKHKDPIAMMVFSELTDPVVLKQQSQYTQRKVTPPNLKFRTGSDT